MLRKPEPTRCVFFSTRSKGDFVTGVPEVARVTAHEAAHAVVARVIGLGVAGIFTADELYERCKTNSYGRVQFGPPAHGRLVAWVE